jgi:hypothetical protein
LALEGGDIHDEASLTALREVVQAEVQRAAERSTHAGVGRPQADHGAPATSRRVGRA